MTQDRNIRATTATRSPLVALALVALAFGLWVAADGRHHWDELTYLYAGAYVEAGDVIGGQVQPSGIGHFTQGRILHALIVKGVMQTAGSPPAGFMAMLAINLVLLGASVLLLHRILHALLPDLGWTREATALVAMSPVILYLAFRVLADAEALCAALLATYALLRLAQGGSLGFAALAAASGIAAIIATYATLEWLGIGVGAYGSSYRGLASGQVPLVAKVLNIGTELGVLWLLLPFALLTTRRREFAAFALWFGLAMAPFVLVINSIEARHVAVNLVAAGALFALALEAVTHRWRSLQRGAALAAIAVIMATDAAVLAIMPHRDDTGEMRQAIDTLDARFGAGGYVLLTATGYTDFHMIRVLWPGIDVRDPSTAETYVHPGARSREQALEAWYGGRQVETLASLRKIGKPWRTWATGRHSRPRTCTTCWRRFLPHSPHACSARSALTTACSRFQRSGCWTVST